MHMCACLCMPLFAGHLQRPEKGIKLHGPGLGDSCEPLDTGAKISTLMLRKNSKWCQTQNHHLSIPQKHILFSLKQLSAVHPAVNPLKNVNQKGQVNNTQKNWSHGSKQPSFEVNIKT